MELSPRLLYLPLALHIAIVLLPVGSNIDYIPNAMTITADSRSKVF